MDELQIDGHGDVVTVDGDVVAYSGSVKCEWLLQDMVAAYNAHIRAHSARSTDTGVTANG